MAERLQKIMARAGIASRRKAEELIARGRVRVNGVVAKLGDSALETDVITVNGTPVMRGGAVAVWQSVARQPSRLQSAVARWRVR